MHRPLRNKKILITAGPTWVPLDRVRVITNISSGLTGMTIARHAARLGADVTLFLGPVASGYRLQATGYRLQAAACRVKIIRFKYFDELQKLISHELRRKKYDIIIHGAAVSDYRPVRVAAKKIRSGKKRLVIYLRPTIKIINKIRQYAKGTFLVMFKLEFQKRRRELIDIAYKAMRRSNADLVVANNIDEAGERRHKAYIVDADKKIIEVRTKEELAGILSKVILGKS